MRANELGISEYYFVIFILIIIGFLILRKKINKSDNGDYRKDLKERAINAVREATDNELEVNVLICNKVIVKVEFSRGKTATYDNYLLNFDEDTKIIKLFKFDGLNVELIHVLTSSDTRYNFTVKENKIVVYDKNRHVADIKNKPSKSRKDYFAFNQVEEFERFKQFLFKNGFKVK